MLSVPQHHSLHPRHKHHVSSCLRLFVWNTAPRRRIGLRSRGRILGLRLRLGARHRALSQPRLRSAVFVSSTTGNRRRSDFAAPAPAAPRSATLRRARRQPLKYRGCSTRSANISELQRQVFSTMSDTVVACCEEEFLIVVGENGALSIEAFTLDSRDRTRHLTYVFMNSEAEGRLERWTH